MNACSARLEIHPFLNYQRKTYKLANRFLQLSDMFIEKFVNFKALSGINPLPARSLFLQIMLRLKKLPEKGGHWT